MAGLWMIPRGMRYSERLTMPNDECEGCGISYVGLFEVTSVFVPACIAHDAAYDRHDAGLELRSRSEVDGAFLETMLRIAGRSWTLKARAYLYYSLARTFGGFFW